MESQHLSVLGVSTKTRLASCIKTFNPHCIDDLVCRYSEGELARINRRIKRLGGDQVRRPAVKKDV